MVKDTHILVIDQEKGVLDSFGDVFTREGYKVAKAQDWSAASEHLKSQKFNVVIAEVSLADINYIEMIEGIRSENKYACIITTAGFSDIDTARDSLKRGADDYISKPFDPRDVLVSIRRMVEKQDLEVDNIQLLDTIKVLALALDARDHYTHGHSQEVTDISVKIAKKMNLSFDYIQRLRDAGMLHDIGKIGVSDAILLKPAALTIDEYNTIKKHPEIAKKILEPVSSLADKIPLIYHHHERFDGDGYPEGLKGENIPVGARILAVADAYQAMTSNRPYRNALTQAVAIEELIVNKGKQFDPQIVDVFLEILERT